MLQKNRRLTFVRQLKNAVVHCPALLGVIILLALTSTDCRKEPEGVIDPDYGSPYILSISLSDVRIDLDTSTTLSLKRNSDGTYTITDTITALVIDPIDGNNIQSCSYRVIPPGYSYPNQTGTIQRTVVSGNSASFEGTVSFTINRSDIGGYSIAITAEGKTAFVSNSLFATLIISRRNARPKLSNLLVPDTLHRPNTGAQIVRFAVSASDSDGLADIAKVFFKSINSTSPDFEQPMFDDGNLALDGDSVALDGRYARLLTLDSTATLGRKEFRFWARDKSGALSDSLVRFITVLTP